MTDSQCGTCTLCCKIMAVADIAKPRDHWCSACSPGQGCNVYGKRPQSCQDFVCGYLSLVHGGSNPPLSLRPDRSKVIIAQGNRSDVMVCHVDKNFPGAHEREPIKTYIERALVNGLTVIVACGNDRKAFSNNVRPGTRLAWREIQ